MLFCIKSAVYSCKYIIILNTELFIAKRIRGVRGSRSNISRPIVVIAVITVAIGIVVMILAVSITRGFKSEIRKKIIGFGGHIQIMNFDSNTSYETIPVSKNQTFYPSIASVQGIKHIQVYGVKAGIIKTETDIQGVVLKGIGEDFDWSFFNLYLVEGRAPEIDYSSKFPSKEVWISKSLSKLLKLSLKDKLYMYFVQDPPRMRAFSIVGIYETNYAEMDKKFIITDIRNIQKLNNWSEDQVSGFEILIDDFSQLDKMTEKVYNLAGLQFDEYGAKLKIQNIRLMYPQIFDWLALQDMNVYVIIVLMVYIALVNIISALLIIILERSQMIGILKSLGAANWSVRRVFIYLGAYIISFGLLCGNIVGVGLCLLQKYLNIIPLDPESYYVTTVPVNLSIIDLVIINIGTFVTTLIIMLIPSYFIANISPIKSIRFN